MSTATGRAACPPEQVGDVLRNGWNYASWVVGASRMRAVDPSWPAAGAVLHHSVGVWPALIDDSTSVLEEDLPRRLVLQARGWPLGEATVTLELAADGDGTRLTMHEVATKGPGSVLPQSVLDPLLDARNVESLRRLTLLAERHTAA
jgi:hypothetical protein